MGARHAYFFQTKPQLLSPVAVGGRPPDHGEGQEPGMEEEPSCEQVTVSMTSFSGKELAF